MVQPRLTSTLLRQAPATVVVIFIVDENGRVQDPKVQRTTNPSFDRSALAAIKQWKFEPAKFKVVLFQVVCVNRSPLRTIHRRIHTLEEYQWIKTSISKEDAQLPGISDIAASGALSRQPTNENYLLQDRFYFQMFTDSEVYLLRTECIDSALPVQ